jgi:hypothetical protein
MRNKFSDISRWNVPSINEGRFLGSDLTPTDLEKTNPLAPPSPQTVGGTMPVMRSPIPTTRAIGSTRTCGMKDHGILTTRDFRVAWGG